MGTSYSHDKKSQNHCMVFGQLTPSLHTFVSTLTNSPVRMATPPFNLHDYDADSMPLFSKGKQTNVSVFGPSAIESVTNLIKRIDDMDVGIPVLGKALPFSRIDEFILVQARSKVEMYIIDDSSIDENMSEAGLKRLATARTHLSNFFTAALCTNINSQREWYEFIDNTLPCGNMWREEGALSAPRILMLFGMTQPEAKKICGDKHHFGSMSIQKPWRALEWLAKALASGYGPPGAVSDLVNLIYMLENEQPNKPINEVIDKFILHRLDRAMLWQLDLPEIAVIDAEFDDTLVWKLLTYMHIQKRTYKTFKVYIQLPHPDDTSNYMWFNRLIRTIYNNKFGIIFDRLSQNGDKIIKNVMLVF